MADYTVASVDEALSLLLLVSQHPHLGVTELASLSGNTKARTFRLLYTLEQRGLVNKHAQNLSYSLGSQALYLGVVAQEQHPLTRIAQPFLVELGRMFNENVQLSIRSGIESVCIARSNTARQGVHYGIVNRRPLYVGASAKILLAYAPEEIKDIVLSASMTKFTDNSPTSRVKLMAELNQINNQGYALSYGERRTGAVAIAAPVFDKNHHIVASLSIAGPVERFDDKLIERVIAVVVHQAQSLSYALRAEN